MTHNRRLTIKDRALVMALQENLLSKTSNRHDNSLIFLSEVGYYLNVYLPQLQKSEKTIKTIRSSLSVFIRYLRKVKKLDVTKFHIQDCTIELVEEWLNYEISSNGISSATRNKHLSVLKGYIQFLTYKDISAIEVLIKLGNIKLLKVHESYKEILNHSQILLIIKEAKMTGKGMRNSVMLLLLYETAIRVSELVSLTKDKIYLEKTSPHILIFGKGKKYRRINLNSELAEIMRSFIKKEHSNTQSNAPLFYSLKGGKPSALTDRSVQVILQKSADSARCQYPSIPEHVHPHMFRRSKATSLLRGNTPIALIAQLLGHEYIETTNKYAKYSNDDLAEAIESSSIVRKDEEVKAWTDDDINEFIKASSLTP